MNITCPACAATFSLDVALESEAGREFVSFLASQGALAKPLGLYLGLFRSTRKLTWSRALKLAREAVELHEDKGMLMTAMLETVEALRNKRAEGDGRALENQNYLKKVLKNTSPSSAPSGHLLPRGEGLQGSPLHEGEGVRRTGEGGRPVKGKRAQALDKLDTWGQS